MWLLCRYAATFIIELSCFSDAYFRTVMTLTQRVSSLSSRLSPVVFGSLLLGLSGCASYSSWLPTSGPTQSEIVGASTTSQNEQGIEIVNIDDKVARKLISQQKKELFSDAFGQAVRYTPAINAGDVLEISIWEAPPASLFGTSLLTAPGSSATSHANTLPEQTVGQEGTISIPFAGTIKVSGLSSDQVASLIAARLKGLANSPQVLVRVTRNNSANVTIVGEVANSTRMPLTAKGERVLDALAAAGGVRQAIGKITLQLTRGNQVRALPLDTIIRDPQQNIPLQPGDVLTSMYQPLSFTVLGATGKNDEVNFEAQGISLTQALARAGGLQDQRADVRGVFIFRFESKSALDWPTQPVTVTPDDKVPVVYRIDLKDPKSFFVAQSFQIQNKDVLYVSNAPAAELQKFLGILVSAVYTVQGAKTATQ